MIIFFGGSFNPPHIGHKIIANIAYDEYKPEKFIISATPNPPHKNDYDMIDHEKRKELCMKTFDNKFIISDIEKTLPSPSYTLQTINFLHNIDSDIFLLIGGDSLKNFKSWYKYQDILKTSKLLVYPRLGYENLQTDIPFVKLDAPIIEISSTYIRNRIKNKKTIKGMLDSSIEEEVKNIYMHF